MIRLVIVRFCNKNVDSLINVIKIINNIRIIQYSMINIEEYLAYYT